MTLEEKASMLNGLDFWHLKGVERLGIPSVMVSDGPHGLRKQAESADHLGLNASVPAPAFPTAAGLACSFDRDLVNEVGQALGDICQEENVSVILGPGANIKRSPLCGRNFEYFSEDPFLTGEIAAAHIQGVQSKNVGTSLKHFAMNNQEHRRMSTSVVCDERTKREIYLAGFERAVKKGKPWTVMCSYNKIGGVYSSENPRLLTDILVKEWGFDGYTMTDWGACCDHIAGIKAGLNLSMPSLGDAADRQVVEAVRSGKLDEAVVDAAVARILNILFRFTENRAKNPEFSLGVQHHLSRKVARESAVLLKNNGILPLASKGSIAFIGAFAEKPRYQGGGSSHINASEITSALQAARSVAEVRYAQGFHTDRDEVDEALKAEAVALAQQSDVTVLFAGLPDSFESEGFDRTHMRLPSCQLDLIDAICAVSGKVVVVLHNGSPIELPFAEKVQAILEMYLGGQAVGGATVDLLFGAVSPCGKLAETFPMRLEDNPSYLYFPGDGDTVEYREGLYVGYRWYDAKNMTVRYPFGYGLSYTTFEYSNLRLSGDTLPVDGELTVTVDVTNTGRVGAKEIVQLYIASAHKGVSRPVQELKGFEKVYVAPGKTETVTFKLCKRAFSYYNVDIADWYAENGAYEVRIGASSRDIRLTALVNVTGSPALPVRVTGDTTLGDIRSIPGAETVIGPLLQQMAQVFGGQGEGEENAMGESGDAMMEAMIGYMPLHALKSFAGETFTDDAMRQMIDALNAIQK
ncbi:MAG: glycoside hydrolase family 3 C-terminal domain-containing protein [Clostridia bacterium]|nr:glycoside hydrolase family 3 C-terminal domain-containing protein [Clostridia bacterium]